MLARWMSAAPAPLAGLGDAKRAHRPGIRRRSRASGTRTRGRRRRSGAAAPAAQAHAVRRPSAVRRGPRDDSCAALSCGQTAVHATSVRRATCHERSFLDLIDLASERLGGAVVAANDEFFAPKENLIKPSAPVVARWRIHRSRQVDGRLGNAPPPRSRCRRPRLVHRPSGRARYRQRRRCGDGVLHRQLSRVVRRSTPATRMDGQPRRSWRPRGGARSCRERRSPAMPTTFWRSIDAQPATHVRLRIFPDGGVARLRVHGEVVADWQRLRRRGDVDLAAAEHGGAGRRVQRHVLRIAAQPDHAGRRDAHGRRLGNEAPARPGHDWTIDPTRRARHDAAGRDRYTTFQGQRAGRVQPRGEA